MGIAWDHIETRILEQALKDDATPGWELKVMEELRRRGYERTRDAIRRKALGMGYDLPSKHNPHRSSSRSYSNTPAYKEQEWVNSFLQKPWGHSK